MKKTIFNIVLLFLLTENNYSKNKNLPELVLKHTTKNNYQYFSNILIYPLNINNEINIKNGGNTFFKISIYDENMALALSINTSPFCSTKIIMDSFKPGKYTINMSSESETHQFNFYKK